MCNTVKLLEGRVKSCGVRKFKVEDDNSKKGYKFTKLNGVEKENLLAEMNFKNLLWTRGHEKNNLREDNMRQLWTNIYELICFARADDWSQARKKRPLGEIKKLKTKAKLHWDLKKSQRNQERVAFYAEEALRKFQQGSSYVPRKWVNIILLFSEYTSENDGYLTIFVSFLSIFFLDFNLMKSINF